jgi:pyrroloquinoline quinone biosynthesis protein B
MLRAMQRAACLPALGALILTVVGCSAPRAASGTTSTTVANPPMASDATPVATPANEATSNRAVDGPYALVLGTAQDGGVPQLGCHHHGCPSKWGDPAKRRMVSSLLLCDPASAKRWLLDATPDLPEQTRRAQGHPATWSKPSGRAPLFDAIFLTHGHIGHYTGLMYLGREAYGARGQRVFGSERMRDFLTDHGPWSLLVAQGHVELAPLGAEQPVNLTEEMSLTPLGVPHRDELTDTFGFVVRGPRHALLFLPDIDKWSRWERRIEDVIAEVDVALVDGTFFDGGEIPGRAMSEIPHPFIAETLDRFAGLPERERRKVVFTHLNHSNPALDPNSEATRRIEAAGMRVARELERIEL